jgi:hypothetical protein
MIPLLDGGPIYRETDLSHIIAEPLNALTALPYLVLAIIWLIRIAPRIRQFRFLTACLALLAIGGIGGTLFHALRASRIFLLLDFGPIVILAFLVSFYFWEIAAGHWWKGVPVTLSLFGLQRALFFILPRHLSINISYLLTALVILIPTLLVVRRRRPHDGRKILWATGLFGAGLFCRYFDPLTPDWLTVGSHWLWHLFAWGAVVILVRFVYELGSART